MTNSKMLQAILDGQRAIKEELNSKIDKLAEGQKDIKAEIRINRDRIDKIGLDLAELSDDAPTNDEFEALEKRVTKVEKAVSV